MKTGGSGGWFRSVLGNVLMSIAGGIALLFVYAWLIGAEGIYWWHYVIGFAISGAIALLGNKLRTRTFEVDQETGKAKKVIH